MIGRWERRAYTRILARLCLSPVQLKYQIRRPTYRFVGVIAVRGWWLLLTLVLLLGQPGMAGRLAAQPSLQPSGGVPSAPPPVEEVKPGGFYLKNEKGVLVYVPDISYEQFEELLKIHRNLTDLQLPAFVMEDMVVGARVSGDRLDMDVKFTFEGRALDGVAAGAWLPVPLRFGNAFLTQEPVFEGPGKHFLTFDSGQGGYVCWLQAGGDAAHIVTLHLQAPIDHVGGESRVVLFLPTPLASALNLDVPEKLAEGFVRDLADAAGRPLAFESTPEGHGRFTARGVRGDISLNWHGSSNVEEAADRRLDVLGEIVVTADEVLQEVSVEGHFTVRGFGGPIESFQVRLPSGMRWRESQATGYTVRPLPVADTTAADPMVEVRLDRATTGEVEVVLQAEIPATAADSATALTVSKLVDQTLEFEPARFEFLGAVRHHGHIDLVVRGDWTFEDRDDPDNPEFPRVDAGDGLASPSVAAARYRYFNQQRSLRVAIRQKATRINVEPLYTVHVDAQQARLTAELVCSTSGSRASPLTVRLPFWTVEIVRYVGIDNAQAVDVTANPLIVPIPAGVRTGRQFKLRIEARQDLTAGVVTGTSPLSLVLPLLEPANPSRATVIVSPATVAIVPADNVLLTPRPQQMTALSALAAPIAAGGNGGALAGSEGAPPDDGNLPGAAGTKRLYYRDRGPSDQQAQFIADLRVQPQAISVRVASTVTLTRTSYTVQQRFSYHVQYEPVDAVTFALPESWASDTALGFLVKLGHQELFPAIGPGPGSARPRVQVRLPEPTLGPLELTVTHPPQLLEGLSADADCQLSLPLLIPTTGRDSNTLVVDQSLTVLRVDPLRVEPVGDAWIVDEAQSGGDKLVLATTVEGKAPVLRVSLRGASPAGATVLNQVWIQSWFTHQQRRDRAVFRIWTRAAQVRVKLPRSADADLHLVKLAVDRREVTLDASGSGGELMVPVAAVPQAALREHVLEVWYVVAPHERARGPLDLEAATLDALDRVERTYWQVILPGNEVVVGCDPRMMADRRWQWDSVGWRRQPARDQAELEQWIGASPQDPAPAGTNSYLYTTLGAVNRLELVTTSRAGILLVCSSLSLACGLLLLYVPALRHPALLLAAGVATVAAGLWWPDWAILFAQGALVGVLLAVIAAVFRQALRRAYAVKPAVQGRAQFSDSKIKVLDKGAVRPEGSSKITVTVSPMSVPTTAADSKP